MTTQPSPDVRNAALAKCAERFREEEASHHAAAGKPDIGGSEIIAHRNKVTRNREMAEMCEAALASQPAASVAVGEDINQQQFNEGFPWPDPTPEMLASPEFEAIWQTIKSWDINVPERYSGYMGATGNHVRAILDSLTRTPPQAEPSERELIVAWLMAKAAPHPGEPSQALIYALAHDIQNGAHLPADTAAEGGGE